ncbi:MAG: carboxy terminal-processing peptidase [Ferruginibacter sp.]
MRHIFTITALLLSSLCDAQPKPDAFYQKVVTLKRFLEKKHFSPIRWNDTTSALLYNHWLEELDEERLFFSKADIAKLEPYRTKLDDEINGKSWEFFRLSTQLYYSKIQVADSAAKAFLARPVDFSKPAGMSWPYETYAANDAELALRWQQYIKWRILSYMADELAGKEGKKDLSAAVPPNMAELEARIRKKVSRRETMYFQSLIQTPEEFKKAMQESFLDAVAHTYDPHTSYMNYSDKEEFSALTSAKEFSSGFGFEEDSKGDKTINYLQPGSSAWRSGQVHAGDVLLKVKINGTERDVSELSADELEEVMGGNSSAEVEITLRTASGEIKKVKLLQEKITDDESVVKSYVVKGKQLIGYINLPGFYSNESEDYEHDLTGCANDVSKEIVKLKKDNIAGLVLDLRNNGGGSMWEAIQLAGIFIDIGPVASIKDEKAKLVFLKDPNRGTIYDGPMIVLINGASASASEFLSAALQDYNRALIVGGTTYGKGTAQDLLPLDTANTASKMKYDDYVKVTMGKFYRVNGSTVQWKGVEPDIELPDLYRAELFKEKGQPTALVPDLAKPGYYQASAALPVEMLRQKAAARIKDDAYFKLVQNFAGILANYKKTKTIPLQWAGFINYYKSSMDAYSSFKEKELAADAGLTVENNSFDKERIKLGGSRSEEINKTYLLQIGKDKELAEACNIFADWIK